MTQNLGNVTTIGQRPSIEIGLADKSPLVVAAIKHLLTERDGFSLAVTASDGERFLDAVRRCHFDVGIIGWVMPYLDGRGVLETLKPMAGAPRIIVYTGDADPTLPRRVMLLGAAAFVSKREPPERLLDAIGTVLLGLMCLVLAWRTGVGAGRGGRAAM